MLQTAVSHDPSLLTSATLQTPLGDMIAVADSAALHLLEFTDRAKIDAQMGRLFARGYVVEAGRTPVLDQIEGELDAYFNGTLYNFQTPLALYGSDFQQSVMAVLQSIPYGHTRSYADQARAINNLKAVRAVARANAMNQIAIVIPCHRVIGSNGMLTGYAGGLARKKWLLDHERKYAI